MNLLYSVFDTITHGYAVQIYTFFSASILLAMTIKGIQFIIQNQSLSRRFGIVYIGVGIATISISFWLIYPTPEIVKPHLPVFDPITISPDNPLKVVFDRPISSHTTIDIQPPIAGKQRVFHNAITFIPDQEITGKREYSVRMIHTSLFHPDDEVLFLFTSNGHEIATQSTHDAPPLLSKAPVYAGEEMPEEFRLEVPVINQNNTFTCYSAAARMALSYYGVEIGEGEFVDMIGYDTTERNFITNTWGNPNEKVVGTINGSGPGGYGVHWQPVAQVMSNYRETEVKRSWNVPELLNEVYNGHPVLVWWVNGVWPAKDASWNLPNGEKVYTVNGMHVEVVVGWKGDMQNPTAIYTNDPWRSRRTYTRAQFENLWRWFDNTAIIVR